MGLNDPGTAGVQDPAPASPRPGRGRQWIWVCAGFIGIYVVGAGIASYFSRSGDSLTSSTSAAPSGAATVQSATAPASSSFPPSPQSMPVLTNADWAAVEQSPDDYIGRRVALDVQVGQVVGKTGGATAEAFTAYADINQFDATAISFSSASDVPAVGAYARITGDALAAFQFENVYGVVMSQPWVAVHTVHLESCDVAFGATACGDAPSSSGPAPLA